MYYVLNLYNKSKNISYNIQIQLKIQNILISFLYTIKKENEYMKKLLAIVAAFVTGGMAVILSTTVQSAHAGIMLN